MRISFSDRTSWDLAENEFTLALHQRRASGPELLDLTVSNPTLCGFDYDVERLLSPLSDPRALRYDPNPFGMIPAREAVARYYSDAAAHVPIDRICLTTSTSEAYSFLFRLLCAPGDEVLVASPSYPLFNFLAQLEDVVLREYPLIYDPAGMIYDPAGMIYDPAGMSYDPARNPAGPDHSWSIDLHALESAIGPRTRAIIVVHPNNPTGNFASTTERAALEKICAERGLALIVDEVFLDYGLSQHTPRSFAAGVPECLTFVLSGISKVCALPQMKVSWIAASGPTPMVEAAIARLEIIADTFLSMNAPMQFALPLWLETHAGIQSQILQRMRLNLSALDERLRNTSTARLSMQGGWTAVLRVPRLNETFALSALQRGVIVQPGEFYGLPEGRAVTSLLTPPAVWRQGLSLLPVD